VEPAAFLALLRFLYRFARLVPFFAEPGEVALRFGLAHSLLIPFLAALVEVALQFGLAHSFFSSIFRRIK
jgi:hypothetical protein